MTLAKSNEILAEYGLSVEALNDPDNGKRKIARDKLSEIFEPDTTVAYISKGTSFKTDGKDTVVGGKRHPNALLKMFVFGGTGKFEQLVRVKRKKGVAKTVLPVNEPKTVEIEQGKKEIAELESKLTDNTPDADTGAQDENKSPVFSSAVAENLAKENNVDPALLTGTGTNGKITKKDVQDFVDDAPVTV